MFILNSVDLGSESVLIAVLIGVFLLQLLLFLKFDFKLLKLLPLILSFIMTLVFIVLLIMSTGWDQLGYLILIIYSGAAFLVCLVSCLISLIIKKIVD